MTQRVHRIASTLALAFLISLPLSARAEIFAPSTSTGSYTVSWDTPGGALKLVEIFGSVVRKFSVPGSSSRRFTKTEDGTYSYRIELCNFEPELGRELCVPRTDLVSVVVRIPAQTSFEAGPSGGTGGSVFSDNPPPNFREISEIRACGGSYLDSIQTTRRTRTGQELVGPRRGGSGGSCRTLTLASGEYVSEIRGAFDGSYVRNLIVTTSRRRQIVVGGGTQPRDSIFVYTGNDRFQISGFKGRSGSLIDALGVFYTITF